MIYKVGNFSFSVDDHGYPYWTRMRYGNDPESTVIHHVELHDLLYAVKKAIKHVKAKKKEERSLHAPR